MRNWTRDSKRNVNKTKPCQWKETVGSIVRSFHLSMWGGCWCIVTLFCLSRLLFLTVSFLWVFKCCLIFFCCFLVLFGWAFSGWKENRKLLDKWERGLVLPQKGATYWCRKQQTCFADDELCSDINFQFVSCADLEMGDSTANSHSGGGGGGGGEYDYLIKFLALGKLPNLWLSFRNWNKL